MSQRSSRNSGIKITGARDLDAHWTSVSRGTVLYVSELILERIDYSYIDKIEAYLRKCRLSNIRIRECCSEPSDMRRLLTALRKNLKSQLQAGIMLDIHNNAINATGIEELCKIIEMKSLVSLVMPEQLKASDTLLIVRSCYKACKNRDFTIERLDIKRSCLREKTIRLLKDMIVNGMLTQYLDLYGCLDEKGYLLRDIEKEILERSLLHNVTLEVEWFATCSSTAMVLTRGNRNFVNNFLGWVPAPLRNVAHGIFGTFSNAHVPMEIPQHQELEGMEVSYNPQTSFSGMHQQTMSQPQANFAMQQPPSFGYSGYPEQANFRAPMRNAGVGIAGMPQRNLGQQYQNLGMQQGYTGFYQTNQGMQRNLGQQPRNRGVHQGYPGGLQENSGQFGNPGMQQAFGGFPLGNSEMPQNNFGREFRSSTVQQGFGSLQAENLGMPQSNLRQQFSSPTVQQGFGGLHTVNTGLPQTSTGQFNNPGTHDFSGRQTRGFHPYPTANTQEPRALSSFDTQQIHPNGDERPSEEDNDSQDGNPRSIDIQQRKSRRLGGKRRKK